jgi:hypothetical protein
MNLSSLTKRAAPRQPAQRPNWKALCCGMMLATSAVAVAAPTVATAAPKLPQGESFNVTFPDGELCSFAVNLFVVDGTKLHKDTTPVFSTGPLTVTVTNLSHNTSKTYNVSGPTFRDGTLTGPALILQPKSAGLGKPFLIINDGRVTFNNDMTIKTITGKQTDLCDALA